MKTYIKYLSMLTLLSFTSSSCGVMFGGSRYTGLIIADGHPQAQIYIDGNNVGR
ncbi:MAG: hypothetical protein H6560_17890 [Lewinellaceae bacterium]|nr:hypothetical protein [Lewinellaceae bacterium]